MSKERQIEEFFYCDKDDCFISREKFPAEKTGFFGTGPKGFVCPICEKICELETDNVVEE